MDGDPGDYSCVRCGYNLHGQPRGGACSECGLPVEDTMFALRPTVRAKWFRRMALGALLLSIIVALVGALCLVVGGEGAAFVAWLVVPFTMAGVWLITSSYEGRYEIGGRRGIRLGGRTCGLFSCMMFGVSMVAGDFLRDMALPLSMFLSCLSAVLITWHGRQIALSMGWRGLSISAAVLMCLLVLTVMPSLLDEFYQRMMSPRIRLRAAYFMRPMFVRVMATGVIVYAAGIVAMGVAFAIACAVRKIDVLHETAGGG